MLSSTCISHQIGHLRMQKVAKPIKDGKTHSWFTLITVITLKSTDYGETVNRKDKQKSNNPQKPQVSKSKLIFTSVCEILECASYEPKQY